MVKRKGAVEIKCRRLDIEVVVEKKNFAATSTSIIALPEDLPALRLFEDAGLSIDVCVQLTVFFRFCSVLLLLS
jgi:hypothetical protein